MDVIDYELRRYETMRNELDVRKQPNGSSTPHSAKASKEKLNRSTDDFLDIMNEEKPKEVLCQIKLNYSYMFMLITSPPRWNLRVVAFRS